MMYRDLKMFVLAILAVSLILTGAGCGEKPADQDATGNQAVNIEIAEQPPVSGWLDVELPSEPAAMDACGLEL